MLFLHVIAVLSLFRNTFEQAYELFGQELRKVPGSGNMTEQNINVPKQS